MILGTGLIFPAKFGARRRVCPPPSAVFTGREDILHKLCEYFAAGGPSKRRIFVLFGLGGSGKSEISRKFVEMSQEDEVNRR